MWKTGDVLAPWSFDRYGRVLADGFGLQGIHALGEKGPPLFFGLGGYSVAYCLLLNSEVQIRAALGKGM